MAEEEDLQSTAGTSDQEQPAGPQSVSNTHLTLPTTPYV